MAADALARNGSPAAIRCEGPGRAGLARAEGRAGLARAELCHAAAPRRRPLKRRLRSGLGACSRKGSDSPGCWGGYCAADWRQPCGTIVLNALRVRGGYEAASCCGSGQGCCRGSATGGTDHQALHGPELGSGGMGLAARGSPHRGTRAPAWGELPRARAAVLPRRLLSLSGQCAGQGAAGPPLPGKRDLCAGIARAEA